MKQNQPSSPFDNLPAGSLRILQITDTHLSADPDHCLVGLNTLNAFEHVLAAAKKQLSQPDLVLATGDLVHDASNAGYQLIMERFNTLNAPVHYLPGNHDIAEQLLSNCLPSQSAFPYSHQQGNWSLIMLDSTVPGRVGGHLDERQIEQLNYELYKHQDKHTLVCLHHHPVAVGSKWMDKIAVDNPEPFWKAIKQHPQVRGILYGHVHQTVEGEYAGVRLMATPSTCIQFTPAQDKFGIDDQPPGYRWLVLLPDGEIISRVERLAATPGTVDFSSKGY